MSQAERQGLERRTQDAPQIALFEIEPDWKEHWWGMPSFSQKDARPCYRITVNFMTKEDVESFAKKLNLQVTSQSDSTWYPPEEIDRPRDWEYVDES